MAVIEKRKNKNGEINYRVKIRIKGHPAQYATFKRLTDARRWELQTESAIREGRYFPTAEVKKYTLADAIDRYMKDILPKKSIWQLSKCYWWQRKKLILERQDGLLVVIRKHKCGQLLLKRRHYHFRQIYLLLTGKKWPAAYSCKTLEINV